MLCSSDLRDRLLTRSSSAANVFLPILCDANLSLLPLACDTACSIFSVLNPNYWFSHVVRH